MLESRSACLQASKSTAPLLDTQQINLVTVDLPIGNLKSAMFGGGEGIRTPDPRVANAVLCQLSYTPKPIDDCRLTTVDWPSVGPVTPIGKWQLEIGNESGCGGGI
jgi:hypothetical protein